MGERTRWWCVAALAASLALAGGVACGSAETRDDGGDDAYVEDGAWDDGADDGAWDDGGDTAMDESAMDESDPNMISVFVDWEGEGEARSPVVHLQTPEPLMWPSTEEVQEELINALKDRKQQMEDEGFTPLVRISAPTDVSFDAVVSPIMQASFRAGFGIDFVQYQPRKQ